MYPSYRLVADEITKRCREISEMYTGSFQPVRIQSKCRCPASKPRIHPRNTTLCISNNNNSAINPRDDGGAVWRLDSNRHPMEYVNDGNFSTFWVSTALQHISLTVDFGDVFQVFQRQSFDQRMFY